MARAVAACLLSFCEYNRAVIWRPAGALRCQLQRAKAIRCANLAIAHAVGFHFLTRTSGGIMCKRRSFAVTFMAMLALPLLSGCSGSVKVGPEAVAGLTPDGTIDMQEVQVAYLASGGGGDGTLFYRGGTYPFTIGGLGVGGIGASTISASGEVYKLNLLAQFPGAYIQGRYGFALGNRSGGDLWLQNDAGVILHLKAKREGLMLSLGGDAIAITMK